MTVDRNEDLLAEDPPIILLQVFGNSAFMKTWISLKTMHQQQFEFIQVDHSTSRYTQGSSYYYGLSFHRLEGAGPN